MFLSPCLDISNKPPCNTTLHALLNIEFRILILKDQFEVKAIRQSQVTGLLVLHLESPVGDLRTLPIAIPLDGNVTRSWDLELDRRPQRLRFCRLRCRITGRGLTRQDVSDVDRWITRQGRSSTLPLVFQILLLFTIQLFAKVVRNVIVTLQQAAFLHMPDEPLEVMGLELIVFLANVVAPAIGPQVARGSRASHKIVHVAPDRRPA